MESELRLHRCCFTGHRPEKLKGSEAEIKTLLKSAIRQAIADGFVTFITGMARGVDIWAGQIILELKKEYPTLKLVAASPYKGFEERWSASWQEQYNSILEKADAVRYTNAAYSKGAFQVRNEWMVDRSARVIAVYTGDPGGTRNTILYAERKGVPVMNVLDGQI